MAYHLLLREGWTVNHKRVQRLWHQERLQRPTPYNLKRARPADRFTAPPPDRASSSCLGHGHPVRCHRRDGRRLKVLNVVNEHSRLCLAIRVRRRCKAKDVVAVLEELISLYPAPAFIRSDNGPEFIAHALRRCYKTGAAEPTSRRDYRSTDNPG